MRFATPKMLLVYYIICNRRIPLVVECGQLLPVVAVFCVPALIAWFFRVRFVRGPSCHVFVPRQMVDPHRAPHRGGIAQAKQAERNAEFDASLEKIYSTSVFILEQLSRPKWAEVTSRERKELCFLRCPGYDFFYPRFAFCQKNIYN